MAFMGCLCNSDVSNWNTCPSMETPSAGTPNSVYPICSQSLFCPPPVHRNGYIVPVVLDVTGIKWYKRDPCAHRTLLGKEWIRDGTKDGR